VATDIVMPRLSDSMEEGTILRWIKSQGDEVAVGDELVEIETDKANMVYEADAAGTLIEILAGEGDTLPIGETIARVGEPGEAARRPRRSPRHNRRTSRPPRNPRRRVPRPQPRSLRPRSRPHRPPRATDASRHRRSRAG
jgi:pyruvate/2-oxoglutarate dehydrogenase complex dihydrolipoamide acyltransferase (E2) component